MFAKNAGFSDWLKPPVSWLRKVFKYNMEVNHANKKWGNWWRFQGAQQNTSNQLTCLLLHSGQQKTMFCVHTMDRISEPKIGVWSTSSLDEKVEFIEEHDTAKWDVLAKLRFFWFSTK